ncbi:MAG: GCN5-related N-acetyltransferase [Chromatiaceae bacterium]|nr:GCN5-related N-acetyltransferase [Chromatiaceae bacterium]
MNVSCQMNVSRRSGFADPGNSGDWVLRTAGAADLDQINALIGRAVMTWALPERVKRLALSSYHYEAHDLEHLKILIAEDVATGLIGVAAWEPAAERECPPGRRGLLLHGLYVDPDRQGQGVGSRLLAGAAAGARAHGYDGLLVKAQKDAQGFVQARGLERLLVRNPDQDYANRFWLDLAPGQGG